MFEYLNSNLKDEEELELFAYWACDEDSDEIIMKIKPKIEEIILDKFELGEFFSFDENTMYVIKHK